MENSIYVGLSRATALEREMDTVSNNIANMDTNGFRAQYIMYKEQVEKPQGYTQPLSMVEDYGQYRSNKPGSFKSTGNPLDVALQGPGFLSVQGTGETLYTRDGHMTVNVNGQLVTSDGKTVLGSNGSPIDIPAGAKSVSVSENGTVQTENGPIAQLAVTEFSNINTLDPVGENTYRAVNASGVPGTQTTVVSGMLESSNVNPVAEMTHMINVSRAYEDVQRMMSDEHTRQTTMIDRLTKTS